MLSPFNSFVCIRCLVCSACGSGAREGLCVRESHENRDALLVHVDVMHLELGVGCTLYGHSNKGTGSSRKLCTFPQLLLLVRASSTGNPRSDGGPTAPPISHIADLGLGAAAWGEGYNGEMHSCFLTQR